MSNYNAPWNKGLRGVQQHSPETKEKIQKARIGSKWSSEVKEKISVSQIGIPKPTSGVRGENHHNWNPNRSEFQIYRRVVQRETEKNYRAHKQLINPHNFIRTKCGVAGGYQLDHIVSVKEGFENHIPAMEIASINNLQMLPWQFNRAKGA